VGDLKSLEPGSIFTTTMCVELTVIVLPFLPTELDTTTPMYDGTPLVGGALLPAAVVQALPHVEGGVVVGRVIVPSKPHPPSRPREATRASAALAETAPDPNRTGGGAGHGSPIRGKGVRPLRRLYAAG
jgi:hypothetical protein